MNLSQLFFQQGSRQQIRRHQVAFMRQRGRTEEKNQITTSSFDAASKETTAADEAKV